MKMRFLKILVVLSLLVMPAVAGAALSSPIVFNVDQNSNTGTTDILQYLQTGSLKGINIKLDEVTFGNTYTVQLTNAVLNFTTGAYTGNGSNWEWGPGGSLSIAGTYPNLSGTSLVSGTQVTGQVQQLSPTKWMLELTTFDGVLDSAFANLIGLQSTGWDSTIALWWRKDITMVPGSDLHVKTLASGDINMSAVPIPPTVLLLGAGLVGMVVVRKRIA
jgi:hypothetical protein